MGFADLHHDLVDRSRHCRHRGWLGKSPSNKRGINYVSQTITGVRLVAIQPETPAAKMGLEAGDVVLLCNQLPVHNDAELYAAIQAHPTYCRLKVMRLDGAIKLCETAIYEGPHTSWA